MAGLYLHIPFCRQACSYCDFFFVTRSRHIPAFVDALVREIREGGWMEPALYRRFRASPIRTVYIGGGTPSRLSAASLRRIAAALQQTFSLDELTEFTVEVNPEDVTTELLHVLAETGVTRLSMGIQSFQPRLLEFMHRAHTAKQAHEALRLVQEAGFFSFNVDLIFALPDQTTRELRHDVQELCRYQPPHVSAYTLTIEPATRLGKQHTLGRLQPIDDHRAAHQAELVQSYLAKEGLLQYEVSNFARPAHQALHNSAYWSHEPYLGLGPSAHSFLPETESAPALRWKNTADLHRYLHATGEGRMEHAFREELDAPALASERIMLGLRTREGVGTAELEQRYGYHFSPGQLQAIERYRNEGLMEPDEPLRLTPQGLLLADKITLGLWQ